MPTLELERFAAWIHERSRGCLENSEINALLYGGFEEDDQWTFQDQATQAQWEAWCAAQVFEVAAATTESKGDDNGV